MAFDDFDPERDLVLELDLSAPPDKIYRCWTEPELLKTFFCPAPWTTPEAELDVRPGGRQHIVMAGPEGERNEMEGVYLAVEPGRRLVTCGHTGLPPDWGSPFLVIVLTLDANADGGTHYHAKVRHWSAADRDAHAAMGFTEGWTMAARQLEAVANKLGET